MRLDIYMAENGYAKSRTHAKELILKGLVKVNGKNAAKPSIDVSETDKISLSGDICPYVSRGGLKLEGALKTFSVDVHGMTALDIGASTGGFTDVLLQNGAQKVYAVDSGHGQLDPRIASDPRVVSMEGFNARDLCSGDIGCKVGIAVCDVSFISQTYIHAGAYDCLCDGGIYIGLVKPQFELTREALSKGGIVRSPADRYAASVRVYDSLVSNGFAVLGFDLSPICGGDGNIEYLIYAKKSDVPGITKDIIRRKTVEECLDSPEKR